MKKIISLSILLQLVFFTPWAAYANSEIEIINSWIREAPPAVRVSVAYMVIKNNSSAEKKLVSVSSVDFHNIELHQTTNQDGMMHMEEQSELIIPANNQIELKPNSYHLMMMGRKRNLKEGAEVKITLNYADGNKLNITVPVLKQAPK